MSDDARDADPPRPTTSRPASAHRPTLRSVARFLGRRVLVSYVLGALGALLLGGIELAIAVFLQLFLQSLGLIPPPTSSGSPLRGLPSTPAFIGSALLTIALIRAIGQVLVYQSAVSAMERLQARTRKLLAYEMLLHPAGRTLEASEVNARLVDTLPRASMAAYSFVSVGSGALQASIVAIAMLLSVWREAAMGIGGLIVVGLFLSRLTRRIGREVHEVPAEHRAITSAIQRVSRNAFLVRVLATERREHAAFYANISTLERHGVRAGALSAVASALPPFLGTLLVLVLITLGLRVLRTPSAALIAFLYLFVRMVQSIAGAVAGIASISLAWPQFRQADGFFAAHSDEELEASQREPLAEREAEPRAGSTRPPKPPRIEVTDVSFAYGSDAPPVFSHLSLEVDAGSQIGIVGPSGCGKSTLLAVILGDLSPSAGSVRIDGTPPKEWRKRGGGRVGYVGAEPFLIAGTIADNLLYGCPRSVSDADIRDALERAQLRTSIERLPQKLAHRIDENGGGLSTGQQQRLCLARALLAAPDLLVLDEPSANLDAATEAEVAETIRTLKGQCTVIAVSHRPGLLRHVEQRISLAPADATADLS